MVLIPRGKPTDKHKVNNNQRRDSQQQLQLESQLPMMEYHSWLGKKYENLAHWKRTFFSIWSLKNLWKLCHHHFKNWFTFYLVFFVEVDVVVFSLPCFIFDTFVKSSTSGSYDFFLNWMSSLASKKYGIVIFQLERLKTKSALKRLIVVICRAFWFSCFLSLKSYYSCQESSLCIKLVFCWVWEIEVNLVFWKLLTTVQLHIWSQLVLRSIICTRLTAK